MKTLSKSLLLLSLVCLGAMRAEAQKLPLYIGTYTWGNNSEGVYLYDFDTKTGESHFKQTIKMNNPSFLARNGEVLYAVNEEGHGKITAYNLAGNQVLNQFDTKGANPCHVALSSKYPVLLVSNYSGGSLSLFSLDSNGAIRRMEEHITYQSKSIDRDRQNAAHIHSNFFSKDGKRVYVSDLGADFIYEYEIVEKSDGYALKELSRIKTKLGGGPRHLAFGKNDQIIYSVLELTGELETFKKQNGQWVSTQVLPIFDPKFSGTQGAADVKISKNGKYVYATNRGQANVVAKYNVQKDGSLMLDQILPVGGASPRNLNLSPDNKWLFIGNQDSNQVAVFKVASKGRLVKVDADLNIPKPVCIIF